MLTAKEVALACGVSYRTVLRWAALHGLPSKRSGLRLELRFEPDAVRKWCDERNIDFATPGEPAKVG